MTNLDREQQAMALAQAEGRSWTSLTADERCAYGDRAQAMVTKVDELVEEVFGTRDALESIDAVTATLIVGFLNRFGKPGRSDRIALAAIAALAEYAPDQARSLIAELV